MIITGERDRRHVQTEGTKGMMHKIEPIDSEVGRSIITGKISDKLCFNYANGVLSDNAPAYWIARSMTALDSVNPEWDLTDIVAHISKTMPKGLVEPVFRPVGGIGLYLTNCMDSVKAP